MTTTLQPRRMKTDDRREHLLRAGAELLGRRPYEEVSIDEIARAAGISKGLLYHYFPTKKDFVVAVLRQEVDRVTALTAPDPSLPAVEQIDAALDAFLDYVEHHASAYAAIFRTRGGGDPEIRAVLEEGRERRVEIVLDGVAGQLLAAGADRESAVLRSAVQGWISFVEGVLLRWLDKRDLERDQLRELLRAVLIDSLRAAVHIDPRLRLESDRL
ncbi:MAG TPA: TetR/AcrR family transcriptional regulator [Thermoleophilaceae bacterium]|nr:TetR/AcrR family transcriptional regulator [Thermoleophilaceae bacterium]